MKGYKAFDENLKCRNMQYEVGKTYEMKEEPVCCKQGFHFCKNIADVYIYYEMSESTRICEVNALGDINSNDDIKYCTNKIKIIREIKNKSIKHCNNDKSNSGYCNSGNWNSGNRNSGNWNSGNRNSGDWNSGDWNSGDWNSGNRNSGNWNSGDWNSGNWNSGDWNSGDWNSGNWNSGDWNSGNRNSGIFNTNKNPKINMFDKESDWTINDWLKSDIKKILSTIPCSYSNFINDYNMTKEEKEMHPEYKTIGGYIKTVIVTKDNKQKWWDDLSEVDKQKCYELPNFDPDKFVECLGIDHI